MSHSGSIQVEEWRGSRQSKEILVLQTTDGSFSIAPESGEVSEGRVPELPATSESREKKSGGQVIARSFETALPVHLSKV
jgi:hypothetical protein